jgi:hypothetical protein
MIILHLNIFFNKSKNVYFYIKYNFLNIYRSCIVYGIFDRFIFIDFWNIFSFISSSYGEMFDENVVKKQNNFYFHLEKNLFDQIFLFMFLINCPFSIYQLLYKLKLIYVVINKFFFFRGNSSLYFYLFSLLRDMYFLFYFYLDNSFWCRNKKAVAEKFFFY